MEALQDRLALAEKTLLAFQEVAMIKSPTSIETDASLLRFKNTLEACWKAAKQFLYEIEGLDVGSPKGVIRSSREVNLFTDEEAIQALNMVNDRNLTVHTYNEEVAIKIHSSLKLYHHLLLI